jgi:hypothetical protein
MTEKYEVSIPHSERIWVRAPVACELLGDISRTTLYDRMASGLLETRLVGRVRLFGVASINRLIESGRA